MAAAAAKKDEKDESGFDVEGVPAVARALERQRDAKAAEEKAAAERVSVDAPSYVVREIAPRVTDEEQGEPKASEKLFVVIGADQVTTVSLGGQVIELDAEGAMAALRAFQVAAAGA